jgi:hypothetical protein
MDLSWTVSIFTVGDSTVQPGPTPEYSASVRNHYAIRKEEREVLILDLEAAGVIRLHLVTLLLVAR